MGCVQTTANMPILPRPGKYATLQAVRLLLKMPDACWTNLVGWRWADGEGCTHTRCIDVGPITYDLEYLNPPDGWDNDLNLFPPTRIKARLNTLSVVGASPDRLIALAGKLREAQGWVAEVNKAGAHTK